MLKREDYKAIKRMDRQQMSEYLQRVYQRGFEAGQRQAVIIKKDIDPASVNDTVTE